MGLRRARTVIDNTESVESLFENPEKLDELREISPDNKWVQTLKDNLETWNLSAVEERLLENDVIVISEIDPEY
ncbi:MAG: hypothetical protein ABEJ65_12655, partial [bacterium]